MSKPRVFVTRILPGNALEVLRESCAVRLWEGELPPSRATILQEIVDADALLPLLTDKIDADLINAGLNLRVISNMAVGCDNIDVVAASARNIPVGYTPGVLTETSADFAFALLMAAARRIVAGERFVKAGLWKTWSPTLLLGHDIYGATLGIIGLGRIGQGMARRARGFAMRVLYYDPVVDPQTAAELGAQQCELDDLLRQSDFVSLHVPLKLDTYHLISARELALMKPTAILINTARGGVVDPQAVYAALETGQIAAAALDVTEPEPIPLNDPLLTLDNCLIVPHIASASHVTRAKMANMAVENLLAGLRGEPMPFCFNPAVYKTGPV